ncbi:hypothetical protein LWI28_008627 [Acer negundo]|uniref:MBD domain-containing protein n=1 Tax=Acer negundo TaxID=4023 RepID=A0AAD5IC09_ACENE|nr:hypothetical protein LWI28_008627 [Acer negundo]KAK4835663.1 hypothetical protein QYF36_012639 [Acer negundo]
MENNGENNGGEIHNDATIGEERHLVMRMSRLGRSTLARVQRRSRSRRSNRSESVFQDNMFPAYRWLLPGWIVEERRMNTGRIYKYFYDPAGNMYYSRAEVLHAWERLGVVVIP